MGGMLSLSELAVMITLGAFVEVPIQLQDRGLLFGITAFIVVAGYDKIHFLKRPYRCGVTI